MNEPRTIGAWGIRNFRPEFSYQIKAPLRKELSIIVEFFLRK